MNLSHILHKTLRVFVSLLEVRFYVSFLGQVCPPLNVTCMLSLLAALQVSLCPYWQNLPPLNMTCMLSLLTALQVSLCPYWQKMSLLTAIRVPINNNSYALEL